jgi:hypothetical protein
MDDSPPPSALPVGAPDYLPFRAGAFRLRVGARPLDLSDWIEVDGAYDTDLARKRRLLADRPDDVLAWLPGTEGAAAEVLVALVEHLQARFAGRFTSVAPDPGAAHPIDAAGRLVQEDLCLHLVRDGVLVLAAASVCFPAKWDLRDKIGRPLRAIHDPVPGYGEVLGAPVDRLLARLTVDRPVWRLNWSVNSDPSYFQPASARPAPPPVAPGDAAGERLWLRVERQTLRRFPVHGSVLFTIRTYQRPLAALAGRPEVCAELAAAIRALPPPMLRYKGLHDNAPAALAWLDRAAGARSGGSDPVV